MNFNKQVNKILGDMRTADIKQKGDAGEEAVFAICEQIYQKYGGILIHSFSFGVDKSLPGNIKKSDAGRLYLENLGSTTEIDALYVSPYRIFPIEVKAYKSDKIILIDGGIEGTRITNKSPVHQNEMHARHLYSGIASVIPDGDEKYIVPICVFVDKCKLTDKRSPWQRDYILVTTLNRFRATVEANNTPLDYMLDLNLINKYLKQIESSSRKYLSPRFI